MQLTSKDGNMVVDYYPIKSWVTNKVYPNYKLKTVTFRGDLQHKMLITQDEFAWQVLDRQMNYDYKLTDNHANRPQFYKLKEAQLVWISYY